MRQPAAWAGIRGPPGLHASHAQACRGGLPPKANPLPALNQVFLPQAPAEESIRAATSHTPASLLFCWLHCLLSWSLPAPAPALPACTCSCTFRCLCSNPWTPAPVYMAFHALQVEVEAWRAQLWLQAMTRQGHRDDAAAARLQHCFSSTRLQHFRFGKGVEAMVLWLQGLGLATAIITNGHRMIQRQKLAACEAARLFTYMLVGGEEIAAGCGHEKPHPAIFHK